jgi:hypothetical protein
MRALAPVLLVSLVACSGTGRAASVDTLTADSEPLRSAFDAASGKVRAIFLAAPT